MRRFFAIAILVCAALACARQTGGSASPTPSVGQTAGLPIGDSTRTVHIAGLERSYLVHIPLAIVAGSPLPVVLVFHGGGGNAENAAHMTGFDSLADKSGFLAVYPNGTGRLDDALLTWNAGECCGYAMQNHIDDVGFIRALLQDLRSVVAIDDKRIYATGMSNGALMAYRLACELSDQIAAIGPVSGTLNFPACAPAQPVSVIHFHGTADQHIPYEGGNGPESLTDTNFASVESSIQFWVANDRCGSSPARETFADIVRTTYQDCASGTGVELYTIQAGGHAWPGGTSGWEGGDAPTRTISASQLIWDFFAAHPKP